MSLSSKMMVAVLLTVGALLLSAVEARLGVADVQRDANNDVDSLPIEYIDIDKIPIPMETDWETIDMFYGAMHYSPEDEEGEGGAFDDENRDLGKNDKDNDKDDNKDKNKNQKKQAQQQKQSTSVQKQTNLPQTAYSAPSWAQKSQAQQFSTGGSSGSVASKDPGCSYWKGITPLGCDRGGASNQVIRVKNIAFGSCYTVDKCLFAAMPPQMGYWCPLQARPCCGGKCYMKASCGRGVRDESGRMHSMESFESLGFGTWYANLGTQCRGY